jgi:hypothetical protein
MSLLSSHVKVDLMNDECKMSCILGDTLHHMFYTFIVISTLQKLDTHWINGLCTHIWGLLLLKDGGVFFIKFKMVCNFAKTKKNIEKIS